MTKNEIIVIFAEIGCHPKSAQSFADAFFTLPQPHRIEVSVAYQMNPLMFCHISRLSVFC
jgi:hypothetical protein